MFTIYHSKRYRSFYFADDFSEIRSEINDPVFINGIAIFSENFKTDSAIKNISCLLSHELKIILDQRISSDRSVLYRFKNLLLEHFLEWVMLFSVVLNDHFKNRTSEGLVLIQHNSIKISLGNLLAHIEFVKEVLLQLKNSDVSQQECLHKIAMRQIKTCVLQMQKLAGGRAFLTKNIIDMYCLICLFEKIYF